MSTEEVVPKLCEEIEGLRKENRTLKKLLREAQYLIETEDGRTLWEEDDEDGEYERYLRKVRAALNRSPEEQMAIIEPRDCTVTNTSCYWVPDAEPFSYKCRHCGLPSSERKKRP